MSLARFNYRRPSSQLFGLTEDLTTVFTKAPDLIRTLASAINKISPYAGTVKRIVQDPALPTVLNRVQTIIAAQPSSGGGSGGGGGINLAKIVPVLDGVIYVQRNPWVPWAVGLGIVAIIGGIGYRMGQRKVSA